MANRAAAGGHLPPFTLRFVRGCASQETSAQTFMPWARIAWLPQLFAHRCPRADARHRAPASRAPQRPCGMAMQHLGACALWVPKGQRSRRDHGEIGSDRLIGLYGASPTTCRHAPTATYVALTEGRRPGWFPGTRPKKRGAWIWGAPHAKAGKKSISSWAFCARQIGYTPKNQH